ncbi:MAG TPA: DUF177 domain-containing protein [Polyangiaceae bacterium]|nr:DUF177 domain-containing protein [Polyangiaceae bacterium]
MGKEHEFSILVRDLDAAGKAVSFALRKEWMRRALEESEVQPAAGDGSLEVRVSKSGTDVVLRGKLAAELVVPCARCLEPARVSVKQDLSALAVLRSKMRDEARGKRGSKGRNGSRAGDGDEDEESPPDADMIAYDGETLVLDDLVRDELLLAVPMIPLCSEACPGISRPPE